MYTVTELSNLIKNTLEINFTDEINITGEISNIKNSNSHLYMSLKDEKSIINITYWNYYNDKSKNTKLENGNKVIAIGYLNMYVKGGYYQIIASKITILGNGDIHNEYEKLKSHYEGLGYFDIKNKKQIPNKIITIGVITAIGGAALHDFLHVLEKSNYKGTVYLKNAIVQGKDCSKSIVKCIKELDKQNLDVIIITRGGGSKEDLIGFNDKNIIETIYEATTCIISAVGHEIDYVLSDYVADIRAATPSIAGEIIVTNQYNYYNINRLDNNLCIMKEIIINKIDYNKTIVERMMYRLTSYDTVINRISDSFNNKINNIRSIISNQIELQINKCEKMNYIIEYEYENIFNRKHCMIVNDKNEIISTMDEYAKIKNKKKLKIIFKDGVIKL